MSLPRYHLLFPVPLRKHFDVTSQIVDVPDVLLPVSRVELEEQEFAPPLATIPEDDVIVTASEVSVNLGPSEPTDIPERYGQRGHHIFGTQDVSFPGRVIPWTGHSLDGSFPGRVIPWTGHSLDGSFPGRCAGRDDAACEHLLHKRGTCRRNTAHWRIDQCACARCSH